MFVHHRFVEAQRFYGVQARDLLRKPVQVGSTTSTGFDNGPLGRSKVLFVVVGHCTFRAMH